MPLFSLDERIREWRHKLAGHRAESASPVMFEGAPQQGRCRRVTHANGKIFWAYLWTSPLQDSPSEAFRDVPHSLPEADPR